MPRQRHNIHCKRKIEGNSKDNLSSKLTDQTRFFIWGCEKRRARTFVDGMSEVRTERSDGF